MLSILHSQGQHLKNPHLLKNETYLILLKEPLHVSVRFCVFVLNNEFTPAMANLGILLREAVYPLKALQSSWSHSLLLQQMLQKQDQLVWKKLRTKPHSLSRCHSAYKKLNPNVQTKASQTRVTWALAVAV